MSSFKYWCVVGVLVIGCGGSSEPPPPAHMLTKDSQDKLASVTRDAVDERNATITFSPIPGELADLQVGEIFVLPPTKPMASSGLMYRINSMTRANNTLTIEGRQPPLTDVYKDDEVTADETLTAADIDMTETMAEFLPGEAAIVAGLGPRPTSTVSIHWPRIDFTDDYVLCEGSMPCSLSGHITLPDPQFHAAMTFERGAVNRTEFRVNVDAEVAIEARGRISTPHIGVAPRLFAIRFGAIPLGIWSWIELRLTIRLGVRANGIFDVVGSGFSGGAHLQAGSEWTRAGGNRDLGSATATGTAHAEGFSQTNVIADLYSRAEFGFYVYSISGPYVYFEQGPRLDIATPRNPVAKVGYHVGTGMGGRFDVIDETLISLIDYSRALFEFTQYFWQSANSAPIISVFTPDTSPFATLVTPSQTVQFMVDGYDVEDGPILDPMVRWTSTVDGPIGAAKHVMKEFYPGGPGYRDITATVTDSGGRTTSRTTGVIVANVNPTISLLDPVPATYYTFTQNPIHAVVTSPYFPSGDFCTATGNVVHWESTNTNDVFSPTALYGCAGSVTFSDAGSRVLTFTAVDRYGQTATGQVTVSAIDVPPCFTRVEASPGPDVNNGMTPTVTLTGIVAPGCTQSPSYDYFVASGTPNGVYHEKVFPTGQSVMFTPSTDLADDGFLMVTAGSTTPQTLDVRFTHDWLANSVTSPVFHLSYQWQPK